jgi:hypothetical protein
MSDWPAVWQPVIDRVGTEYDSGTEREAADVVEPGAIRRFLEVLEFDCALHHDAEVARAHGYDDVVAPATSLRTLAFPAAWSPGDAANFTDPARDAQPERTVLGGDRAGFEPAMSGFFQADLSIELLIPVVAGDRLTWPSRHLLLGCEPKETSVGRGAFVRTRSDLRNHRGEVVARFTGTTYAYEPRPRDG